MGVKDEEVEGIQVNCYRRSQVEIKFKDNIPLNISELQRKVIEGHRPHVVGNASYYEETLTIYGLPFGKAGYMTQAIREAIKPFV